MRRFHISGDGWGAAKVKLTPEEEHHLVHVLRGQAGDKVMVFDGQGREAVARLEVEHGSVSLEIVEGPYVTGKPSFRMILAVALPKGKRMDLIVEKAVELGVSGIQPLISSRVVARPKGSQVKERLSRWQRIALTAAKQCGLNWVPEIKPVADFEDFINGCDFFDFLLVGSLGADAVPLRDAVGEIRENIRSGSEDSWNVGLVIGPEGDFTPDEIRQVVGAGAVPVSFGSLVFRVETAALYGLSVLSYELNRP